MKRGSIIQKPILIGLLVILAVIFVPTPQIPQACGGGGSIIWDAGVPARNASHMKNSILKIREKHTNSNAKFTKRKIYWLERGANSNVMLCAHVNGAWAIFVFDKDSPQADLIEERGIGSPFG